MPATDAVDRLHQAVAAVCPITGIAVGTLGDSSTVRVNYDPLATAAQRQAARGVVASFDWSAQAQAAWVLAQNQQAAQALGADQSAIALGTRAGFLVLLDRANAEAALFAAVVGQIDALRAQLGLAASGLASQVPPANLTRDQAEALRQAKITSGAAN